MKQTAVEWLYDNLKSHFEHDGDLLEVVQFSFEQAKEMQKQQLNERYLKGIEVYNTKFKNKCEHNRSDDSKEFAKETEDKKLLKMLHKFGFDYTYNYRGEKTIYEWIPEWFEEFKRIEEQFKNK